MIKKIKIISCLLLVISLFMIYSRERSTTIVVNAKTYADPNETSEQIEGDMNHNGRLDLADIIILLKKYLGVDVDDETIKTPELNANVVLVAEYVTIQNQCYDAVNQVYHSCDAQVIQVVSSTATFTVNSDAYSGSGVSGFEVYKKNGNEYTSVGSSNSITGSVVYDATSGTVGGTYVVKVYKVGSNNEKTYSDYSEELEIHNTGSPGVGRFEFVYSTEKLSKPELKASVEIVGAIVPNTVHLSSTCYDDETSSTYDCGHDEIVYVLDVRHNGTTFTINSEAYSGLGISGFEVYKKNGTEYTSVGKSNNVAGNVVANTGNGTYVVKVYKTNANNQTIYSEYSEELEISAPNNVPGEGKFTYNFSTIEN